MIEARRFADQIADTGRCHDPKAIDYGFIFFSDFGEYADYFRLRREHQHGDAAKHLTACLLRRRKNGRRG